MGHPGGGLLVFFDDELITFRNKNYRFNFNVKKRALRVLKDIGSTQKGFYETLSSFKSIYYIYNWQGKAK